MTPRVSYAQVLVCAAVLVSCGPSQTGQAPTASKPEAFDTSSDVSSSGASKAAPTERPTSVQTASVQPKIAPRVEQMSLSEVGLDSAAMDRKAEACGDFFRFACGGWLDKIEIPDDKARFGRLHELIERNEAILERILEESVQAASSDPDVAKLGAFYGACMDEAAIEKAGISGLAGLLKRTRRPQKAAQLTAAITELHRYAIWSVFRLDVEPDFRDASTNILFVDTAGLGLPDRDYYLKGDKNATEMRTFYRLHVQRMFQLTGRSRAAAQKAARDVLQLETELARVTKTRVQRRDIEGMYNKIDRTGLTELARGFDWDAYFVALGRPDLQAISVTTPQYFKRLDELLRWTKPSVWSHYLQWHVLSSMASALAEKYVDEDFALRRRLTGQPAQKPRRKRCIRATDRAIGELLGKRYVADHFSAHSKAAAETIVREIARAFAVEVGGLSWMKAETKTQALRKLTLMSHLIGYPETWQSYDFTVDRASHIRNVLAARAFHVRRQLDKVEKPHNRREWFATPQTAAASYNPLANQLVVPAGILQPPFFDADRSVAANLGSIGMIIGHQLTHSLDDIGAQFDGHGNLHYWWQDEDAARFQQKGRCLVDQFSRFEPLPGLYLNGKLTLAENIANLGGVKLAFRAYRSLRQTADTVYVADGLSEDQQFFVAVGQAWCAETREAETRRRVMVDSHSPPRLQILGTLQNTPEFAEAFACTRGTSMNPPTTCDVW
ncbi:MAG: M13 family metallopeptidase [Proteobacteria bacterium]|nr:M13 family metallopeptidase [Pseudomonadota bacterium]